jgi:cell division septum initiation protein DivIVA
MTALARNQHTAADAEQFRCVLAELRRREIAHANEQHELEKQQLRADYERELAQIRGSDHRGA